ncbi:hypothetical protein FTX61_04650 [Nitriliruptoraceae bacterium ZYF776]|nr:hypothetical protein [Profundirhabdus halotolerans]
MSAGCGGARGERGGRPDAAVRRAGADADLDPAAAGPGAAGGPAILRDPAVRGPLTVVLTAGALVYVASFVLRIARHADERRDGDTLHPIDVQARVARAVLVGATVVQAGAGLRGGAVAGFATTAMVALLALALGATAGEPPSGRTVRDVVREVVRGRTAVAVPVPT